MRLMTRLFISCTLLFSLGLLSNCGEREEFDLDPLLETQSNLSALGFISYLEGLDTLERVLNTTEWRSNLTDNSNFTFFAPTNQAFSILVADNEEWNSVLDIPQDEMIDILDYHFIPSDTLKLRDSIANYIPTTFMTQFNTPASLFIKTDGSIRINGERSLALQDVRLNNGVLQLVDEILSPVTVTTLIKANPNLSTLTSLLEQTNFSQNFEEILDSEGPFTIFAPTDSAFIKLTKTLGIGSVDLIPTEVLEQTLLNHISATDNLPTKDLIQGLMVNTLNNSDLEIETSNNFITIQGSYNKAVIVSTEGQGNNGVIHLIDSVLQVE